MNSKRDPRFRELYDQLPPHIQALARKNYKLFRKDPGHPSLRFKPIRGAIWSVRIGDDYRALGVRRDDLIVWFWIGTHEKYNKLIKRL